MSYILSIYRYCYSYLLLHNYINCIYITLAMIIFKIIVLFISGGGPSKASKFSEVELAMLPLLEKTAIHGLEGVQESEEAMEVVQQQQGVEMGLLEEIQEIELECQQDMVEHSFSEVPMFYELEETPASTLIHIPATNGPNTTSFQPSAKKRKREPAVSAAVDIGQEMLDTQKEILKSVESIAQSMSALVGIFNHLLNKSTLL